MAKVSLLYVPVHYEWLSFISLMRPVVRLVPASRQTMGKGGSGVTWNLQIGGSNGTRISRNFSNPVPKIILILVFEAGHWLRLCVAYFFWKVSMRLQSLLPKPLVMNLRAKCDCFHVVFCFGVLVILCLFPVALRRLHLLRHLHHSSELECSFAILSKTENQGSCWKKAWMRWVCWCLSDNQVMFSIMDYTGEQRFVVVVARPPRVRR